MTLICSWTAKYLSFGNIYIPCFSKRLEAAEIHGWNLLRWNLVSDERRDENSRRRLEWMHFGSWRYFAVLETTVFVFVFVSDIQPRKKISFILYFLTNRPSFQKRHRKTFLNTHVMQILLSGFTHRKYFWLKAETTNLLLLECIIGWLEKESQSF